MGFQDMSDHVMLMAWLGSAAASVFVPMFSFATARLTNQEEDNGQNNNNNNNNYNNNYNNGNYYGNCNWWQWGCSNQYRNGNNNNNNNNGQQQNQDNGLPWWWMWANEEQRRDEDTNPTLIFAYMWSLLVFAGVVFYGYRSFTNRQDMTGVVAALIMLSNMAFLTMMYLGGLEGGVQQDGPEIEEDGFYGQVGVLMFLTCLFWTVFGLVFALLFHRRSKQWATTRIDVDSRDYQPYHSHIIKLSDSEAA